MFRLNKSLFIASLTVACAGVEAGVIRQEQGFWASGKLSGQSSYSCGTSGWGPCGQLGGTVRQNINISASLFDPAVGVFTGGGISIDAASNISLLGSHYNVKYLSAEMRILGAQLIQAHDYRTVNPSWTSANFTRNSESSLFGSGLFDFQNTYVAAYWDSVDITKISSINYDYFRLGGSLWYEYMRHSNISFGAGSDVDSASLVVDGMGEAFSLFALGDALSTKSDLKGVNCTGDCGAFSMSLSSINDLQGGGSAGGSVRYTGSDRTLRSATYTFLFADDDAVGNALTHRQNTLTLSVSNGAEYSSVPEPTSLALLAIGLTGMGVGRKKLPR